MFLYHDRKDAAQTLARILTQYSPGDPLLLALPRGGVPLAQEISGHTGWPWDILLAKKLTTREDPEFARGALAEGGGVIWRQPLPRGSKQIEERVRAELLRQASEWDHTFPHVEGRTAIVVDDGVATGWTALAAARTLSSAEEVWGAFPLAPQEGKGLLEREYDRVVCPHWLKNFGWVAQHYENFQPVSDAEVGRALLLESGGPFEETL